MKHAVMFGCNLVSQNCKEIGEIEVPLKLTILKPLDPKWFIKMCNYMTEEDGSKICIKGWKVAGIKEDVQNGLTGLPKCDPFNDIDPITESDADLYS